MKFMKIHPITLQNGEAILVTLNSSFYVSGDEGDQKERSKNFLEEVNNNREMGCLIIEDKILFGEQDSVSIAAQILYHVDNIDTDIIEDDSEQISLNNCTIVSKIGDFWYVIPFDDLGAPDLENETFVPEDEISDSIDRRETIFCIGDTVFPGSTPLDFQLSLEGKASKRFTFKEDHVEFHLAQLPHPRRYKRILGIVALLAIVAVAFTGFQYYLHQERVKAAQARAQKIPPALISSDSCSVQLVAYADWIELHTAYLERYGLTALAFNGSQVSAEGYPSKYDHLEFLSDLRSRGKHITHVGSINKKDNETSGAKVSQEFNIDRQWSIENYAQVSWSTKPMFGYRDYDGYIAALDQMLSGLAINSYSLPAATPIDVGHPDKKIKEGFVDINGVLSDPIILHEIANVLVGVPATCDSLALTRTIEDNTKEFTLRIVLRGV